MKGSYFIPELDENNNWVDYNLGEEPAVSWNYAITYGASAIWQHITSTLWSEVSEW